MNFNPVEIDQFKIKQDTYSNIFAVVINYTPTEVYSFSYEESNEENN